MEKKIQEKKFIKPAGVRTRKYSVYMIIYLFRRNIVP